MELRQIRYFVRVAELGSISRAALDLRTAQSAVSQQITRLEGELNVRLLRRTSRGVELTEAGMAFLREGQLILRHSDQAIRTVRQVRLTGTTSVGFAPTTAGILAIPFMQAMRERFPDVRLHVVEGLSGQLADMLENRKIDVAVLFNIERNRQWNATQILEEKLFLISAAPCVSGFPAGHVSLDAVADIPLILPTIGAGNGLRTVLNPAFARVGMSPLIAAEIDSLAILMEAVRQGFGATIQPRSAVGRFPDAAQTFCFYEIDDLTAKHRNVLCCMSDDELSPAALAALATLKTCMRDLVQSGAWPDAELTKP